MRESIHPLDSIYEDVKIWLEGKYTGNVMPRLQPILRKMFETRSPVKLSRVMSDLPNIVNITEQRSRMPVMHWPWLWLPENIHHEEQLYGTLVDILIETKGHTVYSCGNGLQLKHTPRSANPIFFICKEKDFETSAPDGEIYNRYKIGDGETVILMKAHMETDRSKSRVFCGSLHEMEGYWEVRSDLSILCALATSLDHLYRLVISNFCAISLLQAVHIARGGSKVGCFEAVVKITSNPHTDTIGGQLAVLAAVFHKLLRPPLPGISETPISAGQVYLWDCMPPIDEMTLSNNMYWISSLGEEMNNAIAGAGNKIIGRGNALYFKDRIRLLRWLFGSAVVVTLSFVSVIFQDVHWAEKMEKFLNLLFTATVATIIGVAGIHPEGNWIYNVFKGTRRIVSATDSDPQVFADIIHFIESNEDPGRYVDNEQSCWVSDYNHGTTQLGRPVKLNELSQSKLSVNMRFELCVAKRGQEMPRSLDLNRNGVGHISGPIGTWRDQPNQLFLESGVLVAGKCHAAKY